MKSQKKSSKKDLTFCYSRSFRAGDLVSWDGRTTHCNTDNVSDDIRMVGVMAAGPANEAHERSVAARQLAFQTGLGSNDVKRAMPYAERHMTLMRASVKPRFIDAEAAQKVRQPEQLTLLGQLLYSQTSYGEI